MIELRWLIKIFPVTSVEYSSGGDDDYESGVWKEFKVLQYRTGSYPYQPPHDKEWVGSDWVDVPTVTEDKP